MNKNRIFLISMVIVSILLFLLRVTGMTVHIIVSVVGLAVMIPLTIQTRKEWKIPALEIVMRVLYFAAIITGGIIKGGVAAIPVPHIICAVLFVVLLLVLYIPKAIKK